MFTRALASRHNRELKPARPLCPLKSAHQRLSQPLVSPPRSQPTALARPCSRRSCAFEPAAVYTPTHNPRPTTHIAPHREAVAAKGFQVEASRARCGRKVRLRPATPHRAALERAVLIISASSSDSLRKAHRVGGIRAVLAQGVSVPAAWLGSSRLSRR